jgi:hypothetical protein
MSNENVAWLHLSDWHQRGPDFDRSVVRDALIDDLRHRTQLSQALDHIDFIIFSGDLSFSGAKDEFDAAAREFLMPVMETTQVPKDRVFFVPGNHDLDRNALKLLPPLLQTLSDRATVNLWLTTAAHRQQLMQPMHEYAEFIHRFLGTDAPPEPAYGFKKLLNVRGTKVAIVGMNSAWMCGQKVEDGEVRDYGYLVLGEPQFYEPIHDRDVETADLKIAVLHHPCSWLGEIVQRSYVEASLRTAFHFMLRGHEHETHMEVPSGTSGNCAIISAGAAYDRREYPNGYNFVHLDLINNNGAIYLRRYDIGRGFHKDTAVTGDISPGLYKFPIPKWEPQPNGNGSPIAPNWLKWLERHVKRISKSMLVLGGAVTALSVFTWWIFYVEAFPLDVPGTTVVIGGWTVIVVVINWIVNYFRKGSAESGARKAR